MWIRGEKCVTTVCKNDMTSQPLFTLTKSLVCLDHIDELVLLSHLDTDEMCLCQAPSLGPGSERTLRKLGALFSNGQCPKHKSTGADQVKLEINVQ